MGHVVLARGTRPRLFLLIAGWILIIAYVVKFPPEDPMTEPTYEEMKARLAELEKQVATKRTGSLEFRVSEKGGVSVYGLGRFPVTLYFEQWTRLLDQTDNLRAFLEENKDKLKLKEPK
jgi:hypothetical protein